MFNCKILFFNLPQVQILKIKTKINIWRYAFHFYTNGLTIFILGEHC